MVTALAPLLVALISLDGLPSPGERGSHQAWEKAIRDADQQSRRQAIDAYDSYLREHPSDATAAIERCELLSALTGEEGESPGPSLPTAEQCQEGLGRSFARSPEAVIYQVERSW